MTIINTKISISENQKKYAIIISLAIVTIIAFSNILDNQFINYDDPGYITKNEYVRSGISIETIIWAFTSTEQSNWHPLTWISHLLDYTLFGLDPMYHHAMNFLLHLLSSIILFIVLHQATHALWQSAFVALIFAIHPLHVESVAWAAERKDVLSGLFWMFTLYSYINYLKSPNKVKYITTLCLFILGLLAKPMLVTLPFVLILLDYWYLNYLSNQNKREKKTELAFLIKSIREKIPFFILSLTSSVITYIVQKQGGSMAWAENLPFSIRLENALVSYVKYIWKALVPKDLTVFYPYPESGWEFWQVAGAALLIFIITIFTWRQRVRHPYLVVGWFWFLGTLVPVIGLVQVGLQSIADRYMYIPIIGLSIMIAWWVPKIAAWLPLRQNVLLVLFIVSLVSMVIITRSQVGKWKDSFTLFEHSLAVTSNNHIAHTSLGVALADLGRYPEAILQFRKALMIKPNEILVHSNLADVLVLNGEYHVAHEHYKWILDRLPADPSFHIKVAELFAYEGKNKEAIKHYLLALQIDSTNPLTYCNLGQVYSAEGEFELAKQHCLLALKFKPKFSKAHNILGVIAGKQQQYEEAINQFSEAIRCDSTNADAYNDFGILYELLKKDTEAIEMYKTAVRLKPSHVNAHFNLGIVLAKQEKLDEAEIHWKKVVDMNPSSIGARLNLGRLYTIQGRTDDAIQQLLKVVNLDSNNVVAHFNLANLYVKLNRYSEAKVHYNETIRIEPTFKAAGDSLNRLNKQLNQ